MGSFRWHGWHERCEVGSTDLVGGVWSQRRPGLEPEAQCRKSFGSEDAQVPPNYLLAVTMLVQEDSRS